MIDTDKIMALEAADESLARVLEGLHKLIAKLEARVYDLEATRGLENTARGQHA